MESKNKTNSQILLQEKTYQKFLDYLKTNTEELVIHNRFLAIITYIRLFLAFHYENDQVTLK